MSFLTQSHQVFFWSPLCLIPSTSHVIQRITQSLSSFRSTFPNHLNLLFLIIKLTGSNPKSSLWGWEFLRIPPWCLWHLASQPLHWRFPLFLTTGALFRQKQDRYSTLSQVYLGLAEGLLQLDDDFWIGTTRTLSDWKQPPGRPSHTWLTALATCYL